MLARFLKHRRINSQLTPQQRQLVDLLSKQAEIWLRGWVQVMTAEPNLDREQLLRYHFYDALDYAILSVRGLSHYHEPSGVDESQIDENVISGVYDYLVRKFESKYVDTPIQPLNVNFPTFDYGSVSGNDFVRQAKYVLDHKGMFERFGIEETIKRLGVSNQWIKRLAGHARSANDFISQLEKVYQQAVEWTGKAKLFPSKIEVYNQKNYATIFLSFPEPSVLADAIGATEDQAEQIIEDINNNTQAHYDDVIGWVKFFRHPDKNAWIIREIQSDVLQNWSNLKRTGPLKQTDLYTNKVYDIGESKRPEWIDQYNAKLENLFRDFDKLLVNMVLESAERNGTDEVLIPTGLAVAESYARFVGQENVEKLKRLYDGLAAKFHSVGTEQFDGLTYNVLLPEQTLVKTLRASRICRSLLDLAKKQARN